MNGRTRTGGIEVERDLRARSAGGRWPTTPGGRRLPSAAGRGFTLIEVLVSVAITAVIGGLIVAIVSNVSGFWSRTSGRLSAEAQARYVLDQLTLDLEGALYRDDGNVWMAADIVNAANGNVGVSWQSAGTNSGAKPVSLSLDVASTSIADSRFGVAGVWLRFLTTARGSNTNTATLSAPIAVGYQIVRRFSSTNAQNRDTAYSLHRVVARPATNGGRPGVLESGYDIMGPAYTVGGGSTNNGGTTGDPRTIQVVTTNPRNLDSVFGQGVIDFGMKCYVWDRGSRDGVKLIFPALASGSAGLLVTKPGYSPPSSPNPTRLRASLPSNVAMTPDNYQSLFPDVIDVMVRVLTDEGARLIAAYEASPQRITAAAGRTAQQYWWDLALANSRVFTRRVIVNAKPL